MAERVKPTFPGSDQPIPPIKEERLLKPDPDDEDEDQDEEKPPQYKREEIGPRIGLDTNEARASVAEAKEALDTDDVVPLIFPKEVRIQDRGIMHHFGAGVHLVPVSLAGKTPKEMHPWLKSNRVRRAGKAMPNPNAEQKAEAPSEE